jgi:hypothetical protein
MPIVRAGEMRVKRTPIVANEKSAVMAYQVVRVTRGTSSPAPKKLRGRKRG